MHINLEEDDIQYIERVKSLNAIHQYSSSVNQNLVRIYSKYNDDLPEIAASSCCSSERKIFFVFFMQWYDTLTK